jgi:ribonuclease HI
MKPDECKLIEVYVDGGCRFNGTPQAKCYGSFAVFATDMHNGREQKKIEHFDLPDAKTNNQAEYRSLIRALLYLKGLWSHFRTAGVDPDLRIYCDSELVVFQISGANKCRDVDLIPLRNQCVALLDDLIASLVRTPREKIEAVLGH